MAFADRFHVGTTDPGLRATVGSTELGAAVVGGKVRVQLNALSTAELKLSTKLLAGQPVDYFGTVAVQLAGRSSPHFTGNVVTADPVEEEIVLDCQTHPTLTESKVGFFESLNADPREVMHLMTRSGGLSEDLVNIEGLDRLPLEMIEVFAPLTGVVVDAPLRLGRLSLLDPSQSMPLVGLFSEGEARKAFEAADCHALYRQVDRRMLDVELRALSAIDTVLAWVVTRARYGLAHLPHGEAQSFIRARALSRPSRGQVVLSRGLDTGRAWLRSLAVTAPNEAIPLQSASTQWTPSSPDSLTVAQQLGLTSLRRAVDAEDALQRVQALFEAIEFYVAGVRVPHRFKDAEAKHIRKSIPGDVDPGLRERALQLLQSLNNPPLMAKVRETARRDGVPLTEGEMKLLSRVRGARNDTVHGRAAEPPSQDELNYAVSVVSRLLLHGIANRTAT